MSSQLDIKSKFEFFRNNNIVYLDNAATTQVPDSVVNAVDQVLTFRGNPNRGAHLVAEKNKKGVEDARENIARFLNVSSKELVFTGNTTDSINLAVDALEQYIKSGDEIIISVAEHHSNMLPFEKLVKKGAKLKVVALKEDIIDVDALYASITTKTKIIALNHISNVLGTINPVESIGKYIRHHFPHIIYMIDGAQAVAHVPVDLDKIGCDVYAFSSHKMYGPCGVGVLFLAERIHHHLAPTRIGGGTVKSVHLVKNQHWSDLVIDFKTGLIVHEGGTPNTSNIVGLSAAVNFIRSTGFETIQKHEHELIQKLLTGLKKVNGIKLYGTNPHKVGVVSFSIKDIATKELGEYLDKRKICIRHGSHCAFPLIDVIGTETVRVSFGVYNDESDVDTLLQVIQLFSDKKRGLIKNPNLEKIRNMPYYKNIVVVNSKQQIIQKIKSSLYNDENTQIYIMAGHFLGIPDVTQNTFYPSIKPLLPERLHTLLDEFGMTSFPLFTWEFGCEIVKTLKEEGYNAKLVTIANDTTGINELKTSSINKDNKTGEKYKEELLKRYQQSKIPKIYIETLEQFGLTEKDIIEFGNEKFATETDLRRDFQLFIRKNNQYFDRILEYAPDKENAWELNIQILDNQEIKTCRFDTFNSKTGGKYCIVEVCQFISELFGKSSSVKFNYVSQNILKPKSNAQHKVLVMLTPAMCDDAVSRGAELYIKLMLQDQGIGSFKFFNIPLGPDSAKYLATGATIKYLSDKGTLEEIDTEKEPSFPELWKMCEYKLLYDAEAYVEEMEELFKSLGLNKKSKMLDTCVGPGFFATELLEKEYDLVTADKSTEMIQPFISTLKTKGIKHKTTMSTWLDLEKHFKKNSFDLLFNRGNTFIFAAGGWNETIKINKKKSLESYRKTLKVYFDLLKKGGYLYIDKFKDSEIPAKKVVAKLNISSTKKQKEIIFSVERKPEEGIRYAQMLLRDEEGKEHGLPNMTYDLTEDELEDLLKETGFSQIQKLSLRSEKHFTVYLVKK